MSESIVLPIRYPQSNLDDIDRLVEAGLYKNRSEALRDAARMLIRKHYGILRNIGEKKSSVELGREARNALWERALRQAKGDEKKAVHIIVEEAKSLKI